MHKKRVITALIIAPLLFLILWFGNSIFFLLLTSIVGILCLAEYFFMTFKFGVARFLGIFLGFLPIAFSIFFNNPEKGLFTGLTMGLVISAMFFLLTFDYWDDTLASWGKLILGISYVGFCIAHIPLIYILPFGKKWIFFLFIVIFAGDIGAYYVGHAMGAKKLSPKVSQGKTVEGAVGGLASNLIAGIILWFFFFEQLNPWFIIGISTIIGTVGQIGDLAESIVKRSAGVKDSGILLPGHGGIFDRIDALIFASPVLYWLLQFFDKWRISLG